MYDLTIITLNGGAYIDSREVAEIIGKAHKHLLRDIRGYIGIMQNRGLPNFGPSDFFLESCYLNEQNKEQPCYLLSKLGCELVANKLIGEKGVLFTAAYVTKFNAMEKAEITRLESERAELESAVTMARVVIWGGQMQMEHSIGYRPVSEIAVGLSASVVVQIIFITLGLAALSGIIGVVVITRYEPLKILRERS